MDASSTAPLTPDLVAQLNQLALESMKGSARFKKRSLAKRSATRRTRRARR